MNKYTSAFDKIRVTPEMEKRIIANLENGSRIKKDLREKRTTFRMPMKHVFALAACCVFVFVVTLSYSLLFNKDKEPNIGVTNPFKEYGSIGELKDDLSFELKTPTEIPAEYKIEGISVIAGKTAQIRYSNGIDTITFRSASGNEDISGDYSEYPVIQTKTVSDMEVTFKGNDDMIFLAIWTDDSCAYSLSSSVGMSEALITEMIQSLAE